MGLFFRKKNYNSFAWKEILMSVFDWFYSSNSDLMNNSGRADSGNQDEKTRAEPEAIPEFDSAIFEEMSRIIMSRIEHLKKNFTNEKKVSVDAIFGTGYSQMIEEVLKIEYLSRLNGETEEYKARLKELQVDLAPGISSLVEFVLSSQVDDKHGHLVFGNDWNRLHKMLNEKKLSSGMSKSGKMGTIVLLFGAVAVGIMMMSGRRPMKTRKRKRK